MTTTNVTVCCQECNETFFKEMTACPNCGAEKFYKVIGISDNVTLLDECRTREYDSTGFKKIDNKVKTKFAGVSKRLAEETLTIDRTHPHYTKKSHSVKELNDVGEWEIVHPEHHKCSPAKHRPKST